MNAPQARRGLVPQVVNFEDNHIKAEVNFKGFRKYKMLRWIPFVTGCSPSLSLKVHLKQKQFPVKAIAIYCEAPKLREDSLFGDNYGWFAKDIRINEAYEIKLPMLDRAGYYEYTLNVNMEYQYEGQPSFFSSTGKIMSTGKVSWVEAIILSLVFLILGTGLSFLIQWLTSL
jgi:hypothetical protein